MRQDLQLWIDTVETQSNVISHGYPEITMCTTDTCRETSGWGAHVEELTTRGTFLPSDLALFTSGYINALELLAIKFGLLSFKELLRDKHVLVKCDNTSVVAYIRNIWWYPFCSLYSNCQRYLDLVSKHAYLAFLHTYSWHFQFCGR